MIAINRRVLPAIALILLVLSTTISTESDFDSATSLRLPNDTVPITYDIKIRTDIHRKIFEFSGNVAIEILVKNPTDRVVLHSKNLNIHHVYLTNLQTGEVVNDLKFSNPSAPLQLVPGERSQPLPSNYLTISGDREPLQLLPDERYLLEVNYTGTINSLPLGVFFTSYKDREGEDVYLAATQFEPTSARNAFPCYDEPSMKAKFTLSLTHGANYSALSNMPVDGEPQLSPDDDTMTVTKFKETPLMSTYLVAFVVSNYVSISENFNGVLHSVYSSPMASDKGEKALKNSVKTLTAIEDYFGVKYPLAKLDHIAMEKSYGSAMENWGLITYNENNFIDGGSGANKLLKDVLTQNHELAHQWFGDLVTPKWWTFAWMNEGFATYFGHVVTQFTYPHWQVEEYFINSVADLASNWPIDRPMSTYVQTEEKIKSSFDIVSYNKAACFLKMFHHAMGRKTFVKGVSKFLRKFQYSVADEDDLFDSLQSAAIEDGVPLFQEDGTVARVLKSWTRNVGIPIVEITRNYENGTITIKQKSSIKKLVERWNIPLNFVGASRPEFEDTRSHFIMPDVEEITLDAAALNISLKADDWLIVNIQQTGMYHVIYDDENWHLIAQALNRDPQSIHKINRALLFRDIDSVLEKRLISVEPILELLNYSKNEDELFVWHAAANTILTIKSDLYGAKSFEIFKYFIRTLVGPIFDRVHNLPKTNFTVPELEGRSMLVDLACKVDLPACDQFTKKLVWEFIKTGNETLLDGGISRDVLLCHGLKNVDPDDFRTLWSELTKMRSKSEDCDDIVYGMRCMENPESLKLFLQHMLDNSLNENVTVYGDPVQYLYWLFSSSYDARSVVLDYLLEHYDTLIDNDMFLPTLKRIAMYSSDIDGQKKKFKTLLRKIKYHNRTRAEVENMQFDRLDDIESQIGLKVKSREKFIEQYDEIIFRTLREYKSKDESVGVQLGPRFAFAVSILPFFLTML